MPTAELERALRERVVELATRHNVPGVAVGRRPRPEASRGALLDFDAEASPPAWLRFGVRISVRV